MAQVASEAVAVEALRAAIQAAWIAGDRDLAADIARRYGWFNVVCLRCASDRISGTTPSGRGYWDYQLCNSCLWTVSQEATR